MRDAWFCYGYDVRVLASVVVSGQFAEGKIFDFDGIKG